MQLLFEEICTESGKIKGIFIVLKYASVIDNGDTWRQFIVIYVFM